MERARVQLPCKWILRMNKKDRKTKSSDRSAVMRQLEDLDLQYLSSTTDSEDIDPACLSKEIEVAIKENSKSESTPSSTAKIPSDIEHYEKLGERGSGWMALEVADDCLSAEITHISFGSDSSLIVDDLVQCLHHKFLITHGIDETILTEVFEKARSMSETVIEDRFTVARGIEPGPGIDGAILYPVIEKTRERFVIAWDGIADTLTQDSLGAIKASDAIGLIVRPGEVLAQIVDPKPGDPGVDVYGNTLVEVGESVDLTIGENVSEEAKLLVAGIYGYLCLSEGRVSVIPPFWVNADAMCAYFVLFPLYENAPEAKVEWLLSGLEGIGVCHGVVDGMVQKLCSSRMPFVQTPETFAIARGDFPKNGQDAHVKYNFDPLKRAGQLMEDGGIDLRARNSHVGVTAGQKLVELSLPSNGIAGRNLYGEEVSAIDGAAIELLPGTGVTSVGENPIVFRSEIDGTVSLTENKINVNEIIQVQGDVDYDTGNIESPSDIEISGDVVGGFSVISGGNITVCGVIEAGARLVADGDIIVAQGISGKETSVTAKGLISLGTIHAKFIQNATVMARGDIAVGLYIHNSDVRAGGKLNVNAGTNIHSGGIVGGKVLARDGIQCSSVGSAMTRGTIIGLRPAPDEVVKCTKLLSKIKECKTNIARLSQVVAGYEGSKTNKPVVIEKASEKLLALTELHPKLADEYSRILDAGKERLLKGRIVVQGTLFSGVEIIIGEVHRQTADDLIQMRIERQDEKIIFSTLKSTE